MLELRPMPDLALTITAVFATINCCCFQFMNPLLVVVVVPFLEYAVYPILDKFHIPNR